MVSTGPHGCLCSSRVVRLHWTWQSSKTGKTEARSLSSPLEKKKKNCGAGHAEQLFSFLGETWSYGFSSWSYGTVLG